MIEINGKEFRNLPQQVAKNANDIQELFKEKHLWRHEIMFTGTSGTFLGAYIKLDCHRKEAFESTEDFRTYCVENGYFQNPDVSFSFVPTQKASGASIYFPKGIDVASSKIEISFSKFTLSEGEFSNETVKLVEDTNLTFGGSAVKEVF